MRRRRSGGNPAHLETLCTEIDAAMHALPLEGIAVQVQNYEERSIAPSDDGGSQQAKRPPHKSAGGRTVCNEGAISATAVSESLIPRLLPKQPHDSNSNKGPRFSICSRARPRSRIPIPYGHFQTSSDGIVLGYTQELKHLSLRTRNRLRSLLTLDSKAAIESLNRVRRNGSAGELAQVDRVLWAHPGSESPLIPTLFPRTPQTTENYDRLDPVPLAIQLGIIERHIQSNLDAVLKLVAEIKGLNSYIVSRDCDAAIKSITRIRDCFGYSHFLLRKTALLRALHLDGPLSDAIESIIVTAGIDENNLITSSLVHCYQEEQDFLSMKRSIMGLPDRGLGNKFTRDMSRLPFHPHASDTEDLRDQIQSGLQSSLLDALVIVNFNSHLAPLSDFKALDTVLQLLRASAPALDTIARLQPALDSESEHLFYKRSSAWLESSDIARYRRLLDHFYDTPDAHYFEISDKLLSELTDWIAVSEFDSLAASAILTKHASSCLQELERNGTATRSALFNYLLHSSQGCTTVCEDSLVSLMGRTRDLSKTIQPTFAANLAKSVKSEVSKLLLYLLIAKKSRNERDDHLLRRVVQSITINRFNRDLVALLDFLASRSPDIARYAYEVFTEDFIARLYDLISSTSEITDTRAELHKWMGRHTGEKVYLDRARTMLIDHQLNKVRNEIDDNRIYVDVARFHEWINEESLRDLNVALSSLEHKGKDYESISTDSVLCVIIERCYATFCSHRAFGIASYLGRRIRHGTFKGHLYSAVIGVENDPRFSRLLADPLVSETWLEWKAGYEVKIDEIIRERLHVASSTKRNGLLKPSLATPQKNEIIVACARAIVKEFAESKTSASAGHIITEYCWRLAEVDLKGFSAYLKGQRRSLLEIGGLSSIQGIAPNALRSAAGEFYRSIAQAISQKLMTMQTWFKRPLNVAPKASLSLLYRAVVEEVRTSFPTLHVPPEMSADDDVELFGGAYHVLYDSFYVVVYNAAKHGKRDGLIEPRFSITAEDSREHHSVRIEISSELQEGEDEQSVQRRLSINADHDVDNAQMYEHRSGIPKLYQLQAVDPSFSIKSIRCSERRVTVVLSYLLEH